MVINEECKKCQIKRNVDKYPDNVTKEEIKKYIKSKNGRDISRVNYEEQEILFMRNSKFRCEDKSVINGICRIFLTEI